MTWGSAFADMPNEYFAPRPADEIFMCKERNRKMIGKIAIGVLCLVYFGAGFKSCGLSAAEADRAGDLAQASERPAPKEQLPPEAASPLPQGKPRGEPAKAEPPAAAPKSEASKPFEPTEKVKADQALDFPADI
jgi:hypothetical protein